LALSLGLRPADALQGTKVDQDVNEGVEVSDSLTVAEFGSLDAQSNGLRIDAFGGSTLIVDLFVDVTVPVELITKASADRGRHSGVTTALGPLLVVNGTGLSRLFRKEQGTSVSAAFVLDASGLGPENVFEGHGQAGLTER